ncbi:MAG: alginate export family protein [Candidatus Aminicenantaceae bacterium]
MVKKRTYLILAFVVFLVVPGLADTLGDAASKGKVSVDLRYRFELVDQDGFEKNAEASTLRLRLGYTTKEFYGFSIHVDMETIQVVGRERYNSTDNGKTEYPVVADPPDSELNRAYLDFTGVDETLFRLGRQRIKMDNDRFIGNVGWRQNEQTFDAFTVSNTSLVNTKLTFHYIRNVNRIFGEHHSKLGNTRLNGYVFHGKYTFSLGNAIAYVHFFDYRHEPEKSHQNYGLRFDGGYDLSQSTKLLYQAEFATQHDYKDGAVKINANYLLLELGCDWNKLKIQAGYEKLGGDGIYGFSTPFATLHKFNGWADKFITTPDNGLVDKYIHLGYPVDIMGRSLVLKASFHSFNSDSGSIKYGSEIDLLVQMDIWEDFNVLVKYAGYNAKDYATNTHKFWIALRYWF